MSPSPLASNLGDAVRPNGTLKDASEIVWNYDADESLPFPSGGDSVLRSDCLYDTIGSVGACDSFVS